MSYITSHEYLWVHEILDLVNRLARTCFRIFVTFKRLASKLLALICKYLRVQSSNTVLSFKLTCSTLQNADILDSSIIWYAFHFRQACQTCALWNWLHSANALNAWRLDIVALLWHLNIFYKTSVQLWWLHILVFFTITIKLSLYECVLHSLLYTAEVMTAQVFRCGSIRQQF